MTLPVRYRDRFDSQYAGSRFLALAMAYGEHGSQVDKDGAPYVDHVVRVGDLAAFLAPTVLSTSAAMIGYLHDIVEDTAITLDDLKAEGFNTVIVEGVDSVSRREGESYADLIARAAADPIGRFVKLADNRDNSCEQRLKALDVPTQARLRRKYARARGPLITACIEAGIERARLALVGITEEST